MTTGGNADVPAGRPARGFLTWPWWVLIALVLSLLASRLVQVEERLDLCRDCRSSRMVTSWRFGWPPGQTWPVWQKVYDEEESRICTDLFEPGHEHRWFSPSGKWRSLLEGGGWHSEGEANRFKLEYESDEGFRALVLERIRQGRLTREQVRKLIFLSRPLVPSETSWVEGSPRSRPRSYLSANLGEEETELLQLGRSLFDDYFGADPPQDWWWGWGY